ncbi:MAG: pilus assembly protein [Actinomycetaceae bacterium]|nr:pilus assembly protein [Actinomycetaceae bacterium]
MIPQQSTKERGSAVVGHVLVSILVVTLALGLIQLGLALHVRAIGVDAAGEGARRMALYGASVADGRARFVEMMRAGAPGVRISSTKFSETKLQNGMRAVKMEAQIVLPLLGPWGIPGGLHVSGRAVREEVIKNAQ